MPQSPSAASRDEPVIRDRGDACPGALRLHAAEDGYLARVRIPGGELTGEQAELLARAADRFGDGYLELTSRGNVQLRGLAEGCGAALAELLDAAGLLPAPGHERVRNIVATPLAGLDDPARPDVLPWARELDRLLCGNTRVTALSGRFLFAFDDGRGDVAALGPDVTVLAQDGRRALVRLGPAADAVSVPAPDAPAAALAAAEYFLDAADAAGNRAWRVRELPPEHALSEREFAARLAARGIAAQPVSAVRWPYAPPPAPRDTGPALCALPPLGRIASGQMRTLARIARRGDGMRITPWRTVVLPRAPLLRPVDSAALLRQAGLVVTPGSPWEGVTACTGRPGCAKALADVRADARAVAARAAGPLPVHWSGCERRCGHPQGTAWVDLVATGSGSGHGYGLAVHGRPVPPGPDLAGALAAARHTPSEEAPSADADAVKK